METFAAGAQKYTSPSYVVPKPIPAGAIVVAANAGSDYLFVPDGNIDTVKAAVVSLQSRLQFGAIFVSDKYGEIAGTLPMSLIKTENSGNGRAPDIIVSFSYDENVAVAGKSGVSYASSVNRRGDHGSFSPTDTHISLMASGPDFKSGLLRYAAHGERGHRADGRAHSQVQHAGLFRDACSRKRCRADRAHRIRGAEQDPPVLDQDRIDREAADRPGRPGRRSQPDEIFRRAEDANPHPRRSELHVLRSGQSRSASDSGHPMSASGHFRPIRGQQ